MMRVPEKFRCSGPDYAERFRSSEADGNNGFFEVPFESRVLIVLASDGLGWEHVSVSLTNRTPNWKEMSMIKALFWDAEDCVVQYHPPESEYVNQHEHCLHLWRPIGQDIPRPPRELVGV